MSWYEALKRRKMVQWALAYLAGAWVFVEATDHLADVWGLPDVLIQGLHVAVAVGFVATLVLAWYHGEKGRQRVSGPELLMLAGIFVVGGAALSALGRDTGSEPAEARLPETGGEPGSSAASVSPRSVAVLPLENHSSGEQYAYFADAMSAEISTALAAVPALDVKSYASARRFEDFGMTPGEFAAELGVAHLLEGSVQREEDRIRITVRLVDARTGEENWTKVYEKEGVIEVIDAQIDIARQVADELAAEFSEREFERIEAGSTGDPVAYDLYLQATGYDRTSPEGLNRQIEVLREALRRDSTYAVAWATLGGAFDWKGRTTGSPRWRDSTLRASRRAAAHAVGTPLENNLRATVALLEGRREDAVSLMREEAMSNPASVVTTRDLAFTYYATGELDQAVRWMRRVRDLDPLDHIIRGLLGHMYSKLGLDEPAARALERATAVSDSSAPYGWVPLVWHFEHLLRTGNVEAARSLVDSVRVRRNVADGNGEWGPSLLMDGLLAIYGGDFRRARDALSAAQDDPQVLPYLAHAEQQLGDSVAARRTLEVARERTRGGLFPEDAFPRLLTTAVADEPEVVARALGEYIDGGGRDARGIRRNPAFDRVRDHPAFEAELARLERILDRQRRRVERQLAEGQARP
ncbi:MAG: hypothetical protein ACODAA_08260 [Gemmatimonadota bacterium]